MVTAGFHRKDCFNEEIQIALLLLHIFICPYNALSLRQCMHTNQPMRRDDTCRPFWKNYIFHFLYRMTMF